MEDKKTVGFIGGKFLPLHLGHIYVILEASNRVDELYVILSSSKNRDREICERDNIKYMPSDVRMSWLGEALNDLGNIKIIHIEDDQIYSTQLGIRMGLHFGKYFNQILVGRKFSPYRRGYWERSDVQFITNIFYHIDRIFFNCYGIYENIFDWASPQNYDITALDRRRLITRLGTLTRLEPSSSFRFDIGMEIKAINDDYKEFITDYNYNNLQYNSLLLLRSRYSINDEFNCYLHYIYNHHEPNFHWPNTDLFIKNTFKFGIEKIFNLARIRALVDYTIINPNDVTKNSEQIGLEILFFKN